MLITSTWARKLNDEANFVGETMAKEHNNSVNGCDEVGMSDAKLQTLKRLRLEWHDMNVCWRECSLVRFR